MIYDPMVKRISRNASNIQFWVRLLVGLLGRYHIPNGDLGKEQ